MLRFVLVFFTACLLLSPVAVAKTESFGGELTLTDRESGEVILYVDYLAEDFELCSGIVPEVTESVKSGFAHAVMVLLHGVGDRVEDDLMKGGGEVSYAFHFHISLHRGKPRTEDEAYYLRDWICSDFDLYVRLQIPKLREPKDPGPG